MPSCGGGKLKRGFGPNSAAEVHFFAFRLAAGLLRADGISMDTQPWLRIHSLMELEGGRECVKPL